MVFCFLSSSSDHSIKETRTMNPLFFCIVLISVTQIQGFYIPPKSSCIFSNDCIDNEVSKAEKAPVIRILGHQPGLNSKVLPLSYINPLVKKMVLKQMIDKMLKLRNAMHAKPFRSTVSRII